MIELKPTAPQGERLAKQHTLCINIQRTRRVIKWISIAGFAYAGVVTFGIIPVILVLGADYIVFKSLVREEDKMRSLVEKVVSDQMRMVFEKVRNHEHS